MTPSADWQRFRVAIPPERTRAPRSVRTPEGVGDRLRTAAFAEVQARDAFRWAEQTFPDAPKALKSAWLRLANEEQRHLDWLLARMEELGAEVEERLVSDQLWKSLVACESAQDFTLYMANAEDWGREAGERISDQLDACDERSAALFARIAKEEQGHIAIARRFFP